MSYKPKPTAAENLDQLKRFVNDQFLQISHELNHSATGATVTTGTWTPAFSVGSGSVTYSHQSGNWTRVNDLLFIEGKIELSAESSSGTVQITGLPQPIKSGHQGIFSFHYEGWTNLYAGLTGYADGSVIHVRDQYSSGTRNPELSDDSLTKFTGFYRV